MAQGLLTDNQRLFINNQHLPCQDVNKVRKYDENIKKSRPLNSKERENFLTRKRVMRKRIRERLEHAKPLLEQMKYDVELLQHFQSSEELTVLVNSLIRDVEPLKALRKVFRKGGKGYRVTVKIKCLNCGVEAPYKIVAFRNSMFIGATYGVPLQKEV